MEKLLTPEQVRKRLNVAKSTLYFWNATKQHLIPRRIGGSLRYKESDVEKFINGDDSTNGN